MLFSADQLTRCLATLGVHEPGDIFSQLAVAYRADSRHYHDDTHVTECLRHFDQHRSLAQAPAEIEAAIWFHDAVYDTTKSDNEEQSADWAQRFLLQHDVPQDVVARVFDMIIATKTHNVTTADSALLLDIDLGILGTPAATFEAYDQAIRREYHWVPEEQYRAGRAAILRSFNDREPIYQTTVFQLACEAQAKENLRTKIIELES